jgi:hypothetical protein
MARSPYQYGKEAATGYSERPIPTPDQDSRTIFYVMLFTTGIALAGHTFEVNHKTKRSRLDPNLGDMQILLGFAIATTMLVFLANAGKSGAVLGKGLAWIALITSVGVYGAPVAEAITHLTTATTAAEKAPKTTPKKASTK